MKSGVAGVAVRIRARKRARYVPPKQFEEVLTFVILVAESLMREYSAATGGRSVVTGGMAWLVAIVSGFYLTFPLVRMR